MNKDFKPFNLKSKDSVMIKIEIQGQMDTEGAKEVAKETNQIIADGKRFFIKCVGVGLAFAIICYGISLIKWW